MKRLISLTTSFVMLITSTIILSDSVFCPKNAIKCWADNIEGKEIVKVEMGNLHSACITDDGCLYAWGHHRFGDLNSINDIPVKLWSDVIQVSIGNWHSAFITKDGTLYTWGGNFWGQLGDGTSGEDKSTPVKIMDNVEEVSLGVYNSACITKDGSLYTWGANGSGQLGDGTREDKLTPVKIMDNVDQVSLGGSFSACITKDGSLYTWGANGSGQLGDGTVNDKCIPVKIMNNVTDVSLGTNHLACITKDSALYTCGYNANGQLGDGTTENKHQPIRIMNNVAYANIGYDHSACITKDGSLYTWGYNGFGQLGNGTTDNKCLPSKIMDNVEQISLGINKSAYITKDGELFTFGENGLGQLGDGTNKDKLIPTKIIIPKDDNDEYINKEINNFRLKRDNNSFSHSNAENGDFYGRTSHVFSEPSYFNELTRNSSIFEKCQIINQMVSDWHGSCYGITLSMALVYGGYISLNDISDFNENCYYELNPGPYYNIKFSDMIEYYHLSQYINNGGKNAVIAETYKNNSFSSISLASTLSTMVDKANKNEPYLLGIGYKTIKKDKKGNKSEGPVGHTLLVLGCEKTTEGYDLIIYNCNHRDDFDHLIISKDLNSFKYKEFYVSDGNELSQNNYRFLQVTDMEKMKNTPVLSSSVLNLGKSKNNPKRILSISKALNSDITANNRTTISFNMDSSFILHTKTGKSLTYDGDYLDGNINVLDISVTGIEKPYYTIIFENDNEFTIDNRSDNLDLSVFNNNEFYSVESDGIRKLIANNNGITISGQNYDYDAKTGVIINGEATLVSISGNTSNSITISAGNNKPTITSDSELKDIKIESFSATNHSENKYETADNSFEINGNDASIVTNEFDLGDVNGDGKINVTDITKLAAHIKGKKMLNKVALKRADVNHDKKINVTDITKIAAHIKGIKMLEKNNINTQDDLIIPLSISLNPSSYTLCEGDTLELTVAVSPINATNKSVTWSSNNDSVATVSNGKVTAISEGTATITANTFNGKSAVCNIIVKEILPSSITLNKTSLTLEKGSSAQLIATISPNNSKNKLVTWSSSNTSVATVSNGNVMGISAGSSTITAKSHNGLTISCLVTVKAIEPAEIILNYSSHSMYVGDTVQLAATILPSDVKNNSVTWSSSNTSVATVSNGLITAKNAGNSIITVKTSNGKSASCNVNVTKPYIDISINESSIWIGDHSTISLTGGIPSGVSINWKSSDNNILTVNDGIISALKKGDATVSADFTYCGNHYADNISIHVISDTCIRSFTSSTYNCSNTTPFDLNAVIGFEATNVTIQLVTKEEMEWEEIISEQDGIKISNIHYGYKPLSKELDMTKDSISGWSKKIRIGGNFTGECKICCCAYNYVGQKFKAYIDMNIYE